MFNSRLLSKFPVMPICQMFHKMFLEVSHHLLIILPSQPAMATHYCLGSKGMVCCVTLRVQSLSSSPPSSLMVIIPLSTRFALHLDLRKLVNNMGTQVVAKPLCACIDCPSVPFYHPHSLMTGFTPWQLKAVNSSTSWQCPACTTNVQHQEHVAMFGQCQSQDSRQ